MNRSARFVFRKSAFDFAGHLGARGLHFQAEQSYSCLMSTHSSELADGMPPNATGARCLSNQETA
jgi:hypothetical protein